MLLHALRAALVRLVALKRLWLLYYLPGLILAALVALPARSIIAAWAGNTLAAARLGEGFDATFFIELFAFRGSALTPLLLLLLLLAPLYGLLQLFFSGGALKLLGSDHPWRPREFWDACGRYFGRIFRLFLWSLPLLLVLLLLPFLANLVKRLFWGKDPGDDITLWFSYVKMAGRFVSLMLWSLCFDYARILLVARNEKKSRRLLRPVLRFVWSHFGRLFTLALILAGVSLAGLLLYHLIARQLGASATTIVLLVICQQLFMLFRAGMRLLGLGAQVQLYLRLSGSRAEQAMA
ncbi:MAG TPA: hypothetical protein PKI62_00495 [bacterium]|nr:hypothetical protein [bacterium]HPR88774.1 hypothetical protein [bacterium]